MLFPKQQSTFKKLHMSYDWHSMLESSSDTPAVDAPMNDKSTLVCRVGVMMLSLGTAAWRVRQAMNVIARALNMSVSADIGLLSLEYICIEGEETTSGVITLENTGVNTYKIAKVNDFVNTFDENCKTMSAGALHDMLDAIANKKSIYRPIHLAIASALACGCFTFLLGGGIIEIILAFLGAGVGQLVRSLLIRRKESLVANVALAACAACGTYELFLLLGEHLLGISASHQIGYICSMLFLIPGFPLITGGLDMAVMETRSAIERLVYAFFIISIAATSAWLMSYLFGIGPADFVTIEMDDMLRLVLRMAASFGGVFGFSFLFNSSPKMAVCAGLIGMITNTIRLEFIDRFGIPAVLAAFIAALFSGIIAGFVYHSIGLPRITLTVPSIVIMVPGMFLYKGVYYMALSDLSQGAMWLSKAVLTIFALQLGLIIARTVADPRYRHSS